MDRTRIPRIAKTTLFALFWANSLNFFDRQLVSVLAPLLQEAWQLSDYQVGLLGTAFEVAYALAPVPIAFLADRWLRRRVVALGLAVWSGAMALTGAAGSFAALLLGRAGLGLGEASYGPAGLAWLSDLYPPSHRSRAVGIHDLGGVVGTAGAYILGGILGKALGWRPVFLLAALPGFVLAVVTWLLPEPRKGQSDYEALGAGQPERPATSLSVAQTGRELFSARSLLVVYAVGVLLNLTASGVVYWLPSFAVRLHGYGQDEAGVILGSLSVVSGAAGMLSGGFLADRLMRRTLSSRLLTLSAGYAAGFPLAMGAVLVHDRAPFLVLASLAVYLFTFYFPCLAPLIHQVTRPELRATALAVYLFIAHILGNAIAPPLVGWLSDQTGDLRLGMAGVLSFAFLGAIVGFWGLRFVARDTQAMLERLQAQPPSHSGQDGTPSGQ
jgi:MFS family permease